MRRVCPFVLKADGQHGVGGFGPGDGALVVVVRTSLLRCDEARADQHAGRPGQKGAADVCAVCDPATGHDRYCLRLLDHRGQYFVERLRGLHMAAGFRALADQIVRPSVEGTSRTGDAADLNSHLRARLTNGRDGFRRRNAPRELNNRRPCVERHRKCERIEREQVVHGKQPVGSGLGSRDTLSYHVGRRP